MNQKQIQELHSIHHEAVLISKNLLRDEFLMIEILQRIDDKKVYRFLGFKSLFQYATVALKLSENRAYTFILVSRKARNLSKMQEALKTGTLGLSQAKRISPVISKDNEQHWLDVAKVSTQRSLERAIAKVNPKSEVEEGTRFISENTLEFKAAICADTDRQVKRVQDLLCQSKGRAVSYDETLREMAKTYLEKNDPVIKAQRVLSKKIKANEAADTPNTLNATQEIIPQDRETQAQEPIAALESSHGASKNKSQDLLIRQPIPAELKYRVYLRDQGKCQNQSPSQIHECLTPCGDSRWVDVHHIKPVSQGGENILENLITLCRGHHQMKHVSV